MKTRHVTKKDVEDAAMIAQLIGGADIANASFTCVDPPERRKLHDCPDCDHFEHVEYCDHGDGEWECVQSAIGASAQALDLWMEISNAFFTTAKDREAELRYLRAEGPKTLLREYEQIYTWVDAICKGGLKHGGREGLGELEVAILLREGHLPPGWKLVARRKRASGKKTKTKKITVATGDLPMVRVNMTARGPQVDP